MVVLDVYPARERAEDFPGVSGLTVAREAASAAAGRRVWWLPRMDDAERMLRAELREGDLLLTLGAGDVDALAKRLTDVTPAGVQTDFPLARLTTIRTGGQADYYSRPDSPEALGCCSRGRTPTGSR